MADVTPQFTRQKQSLSSVVSAKPYPLFPLSLVGVNEQVFAVHTARGEHVGNLKRVGALWKFKAVGYDESGAVMPGHGPLTDQHNMAFAELDAAHICAQLAAL